MWTDLPIAFCARTYWLSLQGTESNGVMDWQAVLPVLPTLDVAWALVEQDRTDREPGESLQISCNYFKEQFNH